MTEPKRAPIGGAPAAPGPARTPIKDREDRERIEFELATGKSVRAIAKKFNVHEGALYKHRKKLPPQLKAAFVGRLLAPGVDLEKLKTDKSESLLQHLACQRARLLLAQDEAMEDGNGQLVATLAGGIHRNLELVGRYLGELNQHHTHSVISILVTPESTELRNQLLRALEQFPEARRSVAQVLHGMEGGAAQRMSHPTTINVTPAPPAPSSCSETI